MPRRPAAEPAVPIGDPLERRLEKAVARYGESEVVSRAIALLAGANAGEEFLLWVGGKHAEGVLDGAPPLYWPELWGARTLNYVWDETATPAVIAGLGNGAWRVREMCAKVAATRSIDARTELSALLGDDVPRVRAAAARAFGAVGTSDDIAPLESLLHDPDIEVRRAAGAALSRLRDRDGGERG